ncbi:MAG TPA: hypothetical protein VGQ20_08145 [Acidimicrobiales bacterium]|jgi:hypothetical protein|nr:hypothetical protein [Acidimicrobiales bacterium]
MAVLSTTVIVVKPGRWNDFLTVMRTSKHMLEKHGARRFRLVVGIAAGQASGTAVTVWEADDWVEYGRVAQGFFDDPEGVELLMASRSPEGPTLSWQNSVYADVPLENWARSA